LLLTSPLLTALATTIGAFVTNLVVNNYKEKTAESERRLQRQTDLAIRQFNLISDLIASEAEYKTAAEFALFNIIERKKTLRSDSGPASFDDYENAARRMVSTFHKADAMYQIFSPKAVRLILLERTTTDDAASKCSLSVLGVEGEIARFVADDKTETTLRKPTRCSTACGMRMKAS
jgi:hypothetical protein